jgi:anti-sigma-K factor RskA
VFQVDAAGRATVRLQAVGAMANARTFAVTLEPEAGTPAPTGQMVLAGAVS